MSFVIDFVLKSALSDISISTPAFLSFPFAWNIRKLLDREKCKSLFGGGGGSVSNLGE